MDRRVSVPNIELRIQEREGLGVVPDRAHDDADLAFADAGRCPNPLGNRAAYGAFVVVEQDRCGVAPALAQ